jgi:hypothetical protein
MIYSRATFRTTAIAASLVFAACKDGTGPPGPPEVKIGPPASIAFVAGDNQTSLAGAVVPVFPVAQVRDVNGNGVPGVSVVFGINEGGGNVSATPVTTDATGKATSPPWTLGTSAVPQSLRAFSSGFAALATATIRTDYAIDVRFFGPPMPPAVSAMFTVAAARIRAAVIGDVGDIPAQTTDSADNLAEGCGVDGLPVAFTDAIDDLIIYASVGPIDGVNNVLAFSFPCLIRGPRGGPNQQTAIGIMKFDADDLDNMLANGNLTDVIQHEMLHIVGIGTLWSTYGVIAGAGTTQTRFTGALGIGGCVAIGGALVCQTSVPVENTGGAGTADAHWRESTFDEELMTGFVERPIIGSYPRPGEVLNPFSVMSIQSLGDIGYVVNAKAADAYSVPGTSAFRSSGSVSLESGTPWEHVMAPKLQISPNGKISLVPKQ